MLFLELKAQFKRYSTFIIIGMLFLFLLATVWSFEKQSIAFKRDTQFMNQVLSQSFQSRANHMEIPIRDTPVQTLRTYEEALSFQIKLSEDALELDPLLDHEAYNLNRAQFFMMGWMAGTVLNDTWLAADEVDRLPSPMDTFGSEWDTLRAEIEFPNMGAFRYPDFQGVQVYAHSALYYMQLFQRDIPRGVRISVTPFAFLYLLFQTKLPLVFGVLSAVIGAGVVSLQRETGVLKNKLSQGRGRFILRSYTIGAVTSWLIVCIVFFGIFVLLGAKHGFSDARQPVVVKKEFLTSWQPDLEIVNRGRRVENLNTVGIADVILLKKSSETFDLNCFLPLWKVVLLQGGIMTVLILFWTGVGLLVSILVKNQVFSIVASSLVFTLTYGLPYLMPSIQGTLWDFTGFFELNALFGGYLPVTVMQVLAVTLVGSVCTLLLAHGAFRNQDIA